MFNWGVIFLIKAVDESWEHANKMINEILSCKKSPNIAVLFCLNARIELLEKLLPEKYGGSGRSNSELTTVFLSLNDLGSSATGNRLEFIDERKEFNIKEQKDVEEYFKIEILSKIKAEKYLLFTWDHGSVFGIFRDVVADKDKALPFSHAFETTELECNEKISFATVSNNKNTPAELFTSKYINFIREKTDRPVDTIIKSIQNSYQYYSVIQNLEKDDKKQKFDMLTAYELNQAIKWAFGERIEGKGGVDVLCMMNCYMQFFDTGFELRESVNYFVGPETVMYFNGYNYTTIFNQLFSTPSLAPETLCSLIVSSFKDKIFVNAIEGKEIIEKTALFGNDLTFYSECAIQVDALATLLQSKIPTTAGFKILKKSRNECTVMPSTGEYTVIDFFTYLKLLLINSNHSPEIVAFFNKFQDELYPKIVGTRAHIGKKLVKTEQGRLISPTGFSVFFAEKKNDLVDFYENFIKEMTGLTTGFSEKFRWDNFVIEYLRK